MAQRQRVREIVIQGYVYESEFLGISRADLTPMIQSLGAKASPRGVDLHIVLRTWPACPRKRAPSSLRR